MYTDVHSIYFVDLHIIILPELDQETIEIDELLESLYTYHQFKMDPSPC